MGVGDGPYRPGLRSWEKEGLLRILTVVDHSRDRNLLLDGRFKALCVTRKKNRLEYSPVGEDDCPCSPVMFRGRDPVSASIKPTGFQSLDPSNKVERGVGRE